MSDISAPERLRRQMVEVCPFRVGHCVTVAPDYKYAADYPGKYIIVSLTWEYWKGDGHGINVGIASEDDVVNRHGWTDGFELSDLLPVSRS